MRPAASAGRRPRWAVDARMIESSGIGTYLQNTLGRMIAAHPECDVTCHGDPARLAAHAWTALPHVRVSPWRAAIHSVAGIAHLPRGAGPRPDAVWFPHYVFPWRVGAPALVTVHDVFHLAHPELMGGRHRVWIARRLFAHARARAAGLLFVSAFSAAEFARLVGRAAAAVQAVVANGVDERWGDDPGAGGPPLPGPYLVAVGNVKPHKNLARLVEAMTLLPAACGDLRLVVIGQRDGFLNGDPAVARLAAGLGERVRFTGRISDAEVRRHVAHARALVFPSLYEGFGLPPLEAMAAGTAVVAARIPAVQEVCADAVRYVDPRDARDLAAGIAAVAGDAGERARLVARGRARAQAFTWARTAAATWSALAAVAGWPAAPAGAAAPPAGGLVTA